MENKKQIEMRIKLLLNELRSITDEDRSYDIITQIDKLSPDPFWIDYVYQTNNYLSESGEFNYQKFFNKIFSYKPISL